MSINKLDNLTRRLNKAMRSIILNSDPDELKRVGMVAQLTQTITLDTWEAIAKLLRTGQRAVTVIHKGEIWSSYKYFMDKDPYCLAIRDDKEYHDLFTNSGSDEAYMAHVIEGDCLCWHGNIECGATKEERQDILNFRKGFTQDWWEKNS